MTRMNENTGRLISGTEELRASIETIIRTPKGSIPLLRGFGSDLFFLLDSPSNREISFRRAVIDAIETWEPRVLIKKVLFKRGHSTGSLEIEVTFEATGGVIDSVRVNL